MQNGNALVEHEKMETAIDEAEVQVHRIEEGALSTATDKKNSPGALFKDPEHLKRCGDKKAKAMVAAMKKDEKHRSSLPAAGHRDVEVAGRRRQGTSSRFLLRGGEEGEEEGEGRGEGEEEGEEGERRGEGEEEGEGGDGEGREEGGEEGEGGGGEGERKGEEGKEGNEGKYARLLRARVPQMPLQGLRHGPVRARAPEGRMQGLRHGPMPAQPPEGALRRLPHRPIDNSQ
jgi:hypothetical protein